MWNPYKYYHDQAESIAAAEGVAFKKETSGYDKGAYAARLIFPKNLPIEQKKDYYLNKYGEDINGWTRLTSRDTEQAGRYLINEMAGQLSLRYESKNKQPVSDIWNYYIKYKDKDKTELTAVFNSNFDDAQRNFESEVGYDCLEYFKILDGTININNWKDYIPKGDAKEKVKGLKSVSEFYYILKTAAKEEHLKNNHRLNRNYQYGDKKIETFVFDEENIPQIAEIENKLNNKVEAPPAAAKVSQPETKTFGAITRQMVDGFLKNNIPQPARGAFFTLDQQSKLHTLAWSFDNIDRSSKSDNEITKYWYAQIRKWHSGMIKMLGEKLFKKIFLQYSGEHISLENEFLNKYNYNYHPLNIVGSMWCFNDTNGILCKYGTCKFAKKENWTYDNIIESFKNCIAEMDKGIVQHLNETFHADIYDGSINLKQWIDKYGSFYHSYGKSHILEKVYDLKSDYNNVDEVITAYLRDYKETKAETPAPQPETKFIPQRSGMLQLPDLKKYVPATDNGYTKIGFRLSFLNTPILLGRERVITLANGETHKSIFALVEMDNILASHNENTYNSTENYPVNANGENINDRNYKDDKNAQYKVRQIAEQFNPEVQISTSATAAGLPIITIDGIVVSGNNRVMSMKLMESDFNANYKQYVTTLGYEIKAGGYGLNDSVGTALLYIGQDADDKLMRKIALPDSSYNNPSYIEFKKPVLVRIDLDFPEYNTMEMAKYNKDTKKVERPIDKAIKLGKILEANPACFNIISEAISKFDNISELYVSTSDVNAIKKSLVSCNILTENELPQYISQNVFAVAGKEFLENLMAGMILEKNQLIASEMEGVKRFKQIIVQSLPVLIKNDTINGFSLKQNINEAILIQQKLVSTKLNIADYLSQRTMFADKDLDFSENSYYINMLLDAGKLKFKKAIEQYNYSAEQNAEASMFGEKVTQNELFQKLFIPLLDEKTVAFIHNIFNKTITDTKAETPAATELTAEAIEKVIKGLEIANKYNPSETLQKRITALKIVLKYKK